MVGVSSPLQQPQRRARPPDACGQPLSWWGPRAVCPAPSSLTSCHSMHTGQGRCAPSACGWGARRPARATPVCQQLPPRVPLTAHCKRPATFNWTGTHGRGWVKTAQPADQAVDVTATVRADTDGSWTGSPLSYCYWLVHRHQTFLLPSCVAGGAPETLHMHKLGVVAACPPSPHTPHHSTPPSTQGLDCWCWGRVCCVRPLVGQANNHFGAETGEVSHGNWKKFCGGGLYTNHTSGTGMYKGCGSVGHLTLCGQLASSQEVGCAPLIRRRRGPHPQVSCKRSGTLWPPAPVASPTGPRLVGYQSAAGAHWPCGSPPACLQAGQHGLRMCIGLAAGTLVDLR
jgi:hypothetical protein